MAEVKGELLKWAREYWIRESNEPDKDREEESLKLARKISTHYEEWENGDAKPSWKQLEKVAEKFHVPFGYLFLDEPPKEEELPVTDFRTIGNKSVLKPSTNLLSIIYDAQNKRDWYREYKISQGFEVFTMRDPAENPTNNGNDYPDKTTLIQNDDRVADNIRRFLELDKESNDASFEEKLVKLISVLTKKGVMIIRAGIVGSNTHRTLQREEFSGFVLHDDYAPLIFINGKSFTAEQIFTLVHECVHLYFKQSSLNLISSGILSSKKIEQDCNRIAAEVLLPGKEIKRYDFTAPQTEAKIVNTYKVSQFVVLKKAFDEGLITRAIFNKKWNQCISHLKNKQYKSKDSGGGDYYKNIRFKAGGEPFINAVIYSTLAGKTLYKEAYGLLGLNSKTFNEYTSRVIKKKPASSS